MNFCHVIIADSNMGDASPANHTAIETGREGQVQENSANITTQFSMADVAGATPVGEARHAVARSLTSTQKQDLALTLSSAKYLVNDLMAAYCGLQFFDSLLSTFHIRCVELADLMLARLGVLPDATSDELDGLQNKMTSLLLETSIMGDLLVALRDSERNYTQRHLTDGSLCSMKTSQEAVLYFCQVLEVRFESAAVAMAQFVLKATKTIRDLGMTLPQIQAHTFSLPVNAGGNEVRNSVLAGIREVQARVDILEASLALC